MAYGILILSLTILTNISDPLASAGSIPIDIGK